MAERNEERGQLHTSQTTLRGIYTGGEDIANLRCKWRKQFNYHRPNTIDGNHNALPENLQHNARTEPVRFPNSSPNTAPPPYWTSITTAIISSVVVGTVEETKPKKPRRRAQVVAARPWRIICRTREHHRPPSFWPGRVTTPAQRWDESMFETYSCGKYIKFMADACFWDPWRTPPYAMD